MYGGIMGKILWVDLSQKKIEEKPFPEEYLKRYIGGDGLGARILYDEVPPGVAPLDPEAVLVFSAGPLAGTPVQGGCNYSVIALSPVTGFTIFNGHSNGFLAPKLKRAGYDAIVIKGKAETPVFLWIHNGKVEIRDATALWGKDTWETEDMIKKEVGESKVSCASIGLAGENLVKMAAIVNDRSHLVARGGLGAVMGSKNLKAIAALGSMKVPLAEEDKFMELAREWRRENMTSKAAQNLSKYGTASMLTDIYPIGDYPIKNWTTGVLEDWERLSGQYMVDTMFKRHITCWGCTLAHCKLLELKDGAFAGEECEMPEYEMTAAMGANIGVSDPTVAAKGAEKLDKYGLDGLGTSNVISFLMECYEKGLITKKDVEGLELNFGNYEAAFELIDKIANRRGIGKILADGPVKAAEWIGKGSEKFVVQVKGMPLPMHDHRSRWGYALQYAVGSAGPAHEGGFATFRDQIPLSVEGQAELVKKAQQWRCFLNTLGICHFGTIGVTRSLILKTLSAATGVTFSLEDSQEIALRLINLRRGFNIRHGLVPEDDTLPYRYLHDPVPDGGAKGSTVPIKPMVHDYYNIMGWDEETGKPYKRTLVELGLEDVAKDLWG